MEMDRIEFDRAIEYRIPRRACSLKAPIITIRASARRDPCLHFNLSCVLQDKKDLLIYSYSNRNMF